MSQNSNLKDEEIWKAFPWCEDYLVSSHGRVLSKKVNHGPSGKELVPFPDRDGYLYLGLRRGAGIKRFAIHRIVMWTFCGLSELQVNHKDKDRANNRLDNLEYMSCVDNIRHSHMGRPRGAHLFKGRYMATIRIDGVKTYVGMYDTKEEAQKAFHSTYTKHYGVEPWPLR